jgi:hypothetical protein
VGDAVSIAVDVDVAVAVSVVGGDVAVDVAVAVADSVVGGDGDGIDIDVDLLLSQAESRPKIRKKAKPFSRRAKISASSEKLLIFNHKRALALESSFTFISSD